MPVRSYRNVFDVDRRIYYFDLEHRWPIPAPGGVPLRALGYVAAAFVLVLWLGAWPWTPLDLLAPPLRYVVLPIALAVVCSQAAPDGRPAHAFALAWVRLHLRLPERPVRWHARLRTRWDEHAPNLHRAEITGPALVTFAEPVHVGSRRGNLVVRPGGELPDRDVVVVASQKLMVRP